MNGNEPWVDVDDVAEHLSVARDTIYRWVKSRHLPAHRMGSLLRFKLSEVDEWVRVGGAEEGARVAGSERISVGKSKRRRR